MTSFFSRCQRWCKGLIVAVLASGTALATTVRAPSFESLVERAEEVYHGRVIDRSSYLDSYKGRSIVRTEVIVQVIETIAGDPAPQVRVLKMLGGSAEGLEMKIDGMPNFSVGDEVVLFERGNGRTVCPLVSWQYGHYRISRQASGSDPRVRRADFTPLRSSADVAKPLFQREAQRQAFKTGPEALLLNEFIAEILAVRGGEQ